MRSEGVEQRSDLLLTLFTGCKNFVGKRKKFIFNVFVDLDPRYLGVNLYFASGILCKCVF